MEARRQGAHGAWAPVTARPATAEEIDVRADAAREDAGQAPSTSGGFVVRDARTMEEVRLAACLRVDTFYPYVPTGGVVGVGPRFVQERDRWLTHRRNAEVHRDGHLRALGMQVRTLVALPLDTGDGDGDGDGAGAVLGTCDVHFGFSLPGEPLFGDRPSSDDPDAAEADANASGRVLWLSAGSAAADGAAQPEDAAPVPAGEVPVRPLPEHALRHRRAYVFNLCVSEDHRRRGVARAILREAESVAASLGVRYMYVHVEAHNDAAVALYAAGGFAFEKEETEDVARRLRRPRRQLLVRPLAPP